MIRGGTCIGRAAAIALRDMLNEWIFKTDPPAAPCCDDGAQHPPLPPPSFRLADATPICGVRADSDPKTYGHAAQPIYIDVLTPKGWCRLGAVQDGGGLVAHEWGAAGIKLAKVVEPVAPTTPDAKVKQIEADKRLVERIDRYGKNLQRRESEMVESFKVWLEGGSPLTEPQRKVAESIEERRVR